MKSLILLTLIITISACQGISHNKNHKPNSFVISFGSCNNNLIENNMWAEIEKNHPDVWIWGGDIIYADNPENDMSIIKKSYDLQKAYPPYQHFIGTTQVIGSWDDHDYGLNDGGAEFSKKDQSQQLFLDFMGVKKSDPRRNQKGIYTSHDYQINRHSIKILILDTRYFRTRLTLDPNPAKDKRLKPNKYGDGTMLGKQQWQWLENQLKTSHADFNVIMSSIQVLSPDHGFEKWANMPHELEKLEKLIVSSQAENIILLSGDRHISEFAKKDIKDLNYPLIDFTSSGINRALNFEKNEANPYRIGHNIVTDNFGILRFDFNKNTVMMEIRGENNQILHHYKQKYQ